MRILNDVDRFQSCINDLMQSPAVKTMNNYTQHSMVTTLEHCLFVSYVSYLICRLLGLNYYAAARGGLLHDLFLYDWHEKNVRGKLHGFTHTFKALRNANSYFYLSDLEQDIIVKHMWPLTLKFPRYKESLVVSFVDKLCCIIEVLGLYKMIWIMRIMKLHSMVEQGEAKANI